MISDENARTVLDRNRYCAVSQPAHFVLRPSVPLEEIKVAYVRWFARKERRKEGRKEGGDGSAIRTEEESTYASLLAPWEREGVQYTLHR